MYLAVLDDGHRIERIAGCCARAASGHAVAGPPPMSVMNSRRSFDHLVGDGKDVAGNDQAEGLGSLEVDQQLELA